MARFIMIYTDAATGEHHQLRGAYEAETPDAALNQMLIDAGCEDCEDRDCWFVKLVTDERDVIAAA